jgi:hypothetical protein
MNLLGKRYTCQVCGCMVLCSRGTDGDGELECCSQPMGEQAAKSLPSSD